MAYADEYKGNVYENWIVRLYYDAEGSNDWTGVSTDTYSTYHPIIINKPTIRRSIDLANSKAKTGNISLNLINFNFQGSPFSEELLGGSRKYINRKVEVYSRLVNSSLQIYTGRLIDISHDLDSITLKVTDKRVWDFITIPSDTAYTKPTTYVPVVYGDTFSQNLATYNTPLDVEPYLYPIPVISVDIDEVHTLMPRSYANNSYCHINYGYGNKAFMPFAWSSGGQYDTTHTEENRDVLRTPMGMHHNGFIIGQEYTDDNPTGDSDRVYFTDTHYIFDSDSSTWATATCNSGYNHYFGISTGIAQLWDATNGGRHRIRTVKFKAKCSASHTFDVSCFASPYTLGYGTTQSITFSAGVSQTITFNLDTGIPPVADEYKNNVSRSLGIIFSRTSGSGSVTLSAQDTKLHHHGNCDTSEGIEFKTLSEVEYFYSGGDGLTQSWSGGSPSTAISTVHEAHRDILSRFIGIDESSPDGWSLINTERANWDIRYWLNEPEQIEKVLNKLQYEGGFIFTFTPTGEMRYIVVEDSYSSSDVTLDDNDISKVEVSQTPFSELLTKWTINYNKIPSGGGFNSQKKKENSTARTNWNIEADENIKEVGLDMLAGDTGVDEFYDYYNNIFGDVKIQVKCNIVNPAKMDLDVGDIVQFDLDTKPFGYDWTQYYMITSLTRKIGEMSIECREVG